MGRSRSAGVTPWWWPKALCRSPGRQDDPCRSRQRAHHAIKGLGGQGASRRPARTAGLLAGSSEQDGFLGTGPLCKRSYGFAPLSFRR
jgi:hypothetical protein